MIGRLNDVQPYSIPVCAATVLTLVETESHKVCHNCCSSPAQTLFEFVFHILHVTVRL